MDPKPKWAARDSQFESEQIKYEYPAPSRGFILEYLDEVGAPMTFEEMVADLDLNHPAELDGLQRRLHAMVRDGQLVQNRRGGFGRVERMNLVRGRVIGHPDGFGFLVPEDGGEDVFIPPNQMRRLMHGDRALVRIRGVDARGRREGSLVDVLERNTTQLVGRFLIEGGIGLVTPDNSRVTQDVLVPPDMQGGAVPGQIVVVDIIEQPDKYRKPLGRIREVLGDRMAPGMEINIAVRSHGLPHEWPEDVLAEVDRFSSQIPIEALEGREDLRELPLVTVDGEDAQDFDDAVYCEPCEEGWRLLVAIADVGSYVEPNSALDVEAHNRGNSVYFPGRVIPMLPEVLSNGLCSLKPKVDRLCMVCAMEIDKQGELRRFRFCEGVMRSAARLTYTEFEQATVAQDPATQERLAPVLPHLRHLHQLYQLLRQSRETRGAIDFDTTEVRIEFNTERKIQRIVPVVRLDAHRMIEECMILANVAAARFLSQHQMPTLYRAHEPPPPEQLQQLREFLTEFGLKLSGGLEPKPADYGRLLAAVAQRPERFLIETVLLRSLSRAVYSPEAAVGHFGLSLERYAHFTSPIRRYPDLLVHRGIRHVLRGGTAANFSYDMAAMEKIGAHCSQTERRADEATRDVTAWLKCEYMREHLGETYEGRITGVTSFGLFVMLNDLLVEGLVHISSLPNDYYQYDAAGHRLRGEKTGMTYRLGDYMRVKLARVDLDERKIDFEPMLEPKANGRKRGRGNYFRGKHETIRRGREA